MERATQRTYTVIEAIPVLEATPGDEIVVSPELEGFEVVVMKRYGLEMVAAIPERAVTLVSEAMPLRLV